MTAVKHRDLPAVRMLLSYYATMHLDGDKEALLMHELAEGKEKNPVNAAIHDLLLRAQNPSLVRAEEPASAIDGDVSIRVGKLVKGIAPEGSRGLPQY